MTEARGIGPETTHCLPETSTELMRRELMLVEGLKPVGLAWGPEVFMYTTVTE